MSLLHNNAPCHNSHYQITYNNAHRTNWHALCELSEEHNKDKLKDCVTDETLRHILLTCKSLVPYLLEMSKIGGSWRSLSRLGSDICEKWFSRAGGFGKVRSNQRNYTAGELFQMSASLIRVHTNIFVVASSLHAAHAQQLTSGCSSMMFIGVRTAERRRSLFSLLLMILLL